MCKASIEYSLERAILNLCNLREFEPPHGFACISVPSPRRPRKNKVHHIVLRLISLAALRREEPSRSSIQPERASHLRRAAVDSSSGWAFGSCRQREIPDCRFVGNVINRWCLDGSTRAQRARDDSSPPIAEPNMSFQHNTVTVDDWR